MLLSSKVMNGHVLFGVVSKLGVFVRVTYRHWQLITEQKHLEIKGKEEEIIEAIKNPSEVRLSKKDPTVYLYYRKRGKYFYCAVVKHLSRDGFLITAYLTKNIKEGERIWTK
jgi:hypothetical protein